MDTFASQDGDMYLDGKDVERRSAGGSVGVRHGDVTIGGQQVELCISGDRVDVGSWRRKRYWQWAREIYGGRSNQRGVKAEILLCNTQ